MELNLRNIKIIIIGNSGAGKSTLARKLNNHFLFPVKIINLDNFYWKDICFTKRQKTMNALNNINKDLQNYNTWIIEGVFAALINPLLNKSNFLIFLDINQDVCIKRLLERGPIKNKKCNNHLMFKKFNEMLKTTENYYKVKNLKSRYMHEKIFNEFNGKRKVRIKTEDDISRLLKYLIDANKTE